MTSPTGKVRYAVIGAGNIAQVAVLPAFEHAQDNSELVALVSGDPQKRAVLRSRYGLRHTGDYHELERILQQAGVDAVYIATPNDSHREFTERAARAGVHVLCETPMAATVQDCQAMIDVCEQHDVRLMIAYRLHFEETNLAAIELAQSGNLGRLHVFSSVFSRQVRPHDVPTRNDLGGGAIFDLGVYPINAARCLFRDEPEQVFATSARGMDPRMQGVDETTAVTLRFAGGRVAQLCVSLSTSTVSSYRIVGSAGDLRVEPAFEYSRVLAHYLTVGGETTERTFERRDQFAPEIVAFSNCVLQGEEPEPSGEEGLADVRIIEAVFRSEQTGQVVELPPFSRTRRPSLRQELHIRPVERISTVHVPSPTSD